MISTLNELTPSLAVHCIGSWFRGRAMVPQVSELLRRSSSSYLHRNPYRFRSRARTPIDVIIFVSSCRWPESSASAGLGQLRAEQIFRRADAVRAGKRAVGHIQRSEASAAQVRNERRALLNRIVVVRFALFRIVTLPRERLVRSYASAVLNHFRFSAPSPGWLTAYGPPCQQKFSYTFMDWFFTLK